MATKYRRLTYRDYDSSTMLTALETEIAVAWELMHENRKAAKAPADALTRWYSDSAYRYQRILKTLLAIRREARES